MSRDVVGGSQVEGPKVSRTTPKNLRKDWEACQRDYELGNWISVLELASRHGINPNTLNSRIIREDWKSQRERKIARLNEKVEEKTVTEAQEYLSSSYKRFRHYEVLIQNSQAQLATSPNGLPVIEPSDLDAYTRSENRIHELCLSALRMPRTVNVDVTSKGVDMGTSIVTALEKLRASGSNVELPEGIVDRVLEMEIVPDPK